MAKYNRSTTQKIRTRARKIRLPICRAILNILWLRMPRRVLQRLCREVEQEWKKLKTCCWLENMPGRGCDMSPCIVMWHGTYGITQLYPYENIRAWWKKTQIQVTRKGSFKMYLSLTFRFNLPCRKYTIEPFVSLYNVNISGSLTVIVEMVRLVLLSRL